jgi:hypothetical protein
VAYVLQDGFHRRLFSPGRNGVRHEECRSS